MKIVAEFTTSKENYKYLTHNKIFEGKDGTAQTI